MCTQLQLDKITKEIAQKVHAVLGKRLRNVILFGSYARGDYDEESDIDIMVLADVGEEEIYDFQKQINLISSRTSLAHDITISIMLNDKRLFDKRLPVLPFYRNVVNDGVQLYE